MKRLIVLLVCALSLSAQVPVKRRVVLASGTPTADVPTFSPTTGYSGAAVDVTITPGTAGGSVKYCADTTNACTPTTDYSMAVHVASTGYIRAITTKTGYADSAVASWQGTITVAAPTLLTHAIAQSSTGTSVTTSASPIDTTGANLIVIGVAVANYNGTAPTITDSQGGNSNTCTAATWHGFGSYSLYTLYCFSPTHTGSGHTVTVTCNAPDSTCKPTVAIAAFSGAGSVLDNQSGSGNNTTSSIQPGSLTPSSGTALFIAAVLGTETLSTNTPALTSSPDFTLVDALPVNTGQTAISLGLAYAVSATAENPTWSFHDVQILATSMLVIR